MSVDYDVSRAFKRIENELIDSMIRNLKRHQVEEIKEGLNWEQWQVLQLKELEKYRLNNPKLFAKDFSDVNKRVEDAFRSTYQSASTAEEAKILDMIRQGKIRNSHSGSVSADFFGFNEARFENLVTATKADFVRGEWSMLRQANDQYRKIIFDAQMYSATGATYAQAVDMATKDFLKNGIQSITYRNGSRHSVQEYASMAIRTGQKRAYLMGEGDAHDKYGIHTVRVNKRVDACPLCVKWLGRVLVDDVYAGGTFEEAQKAGVPLLSEAIDEGFLHPNCKDIYSMYVEGISQPAKPWTKEEMQEIADRYNAEQELKKAEDMQNSYDRMARNSLDKQNQQRYQARADAWQNRVDELKLGNPPPPIIPATPPKPPVAEETVETVAKVEKAMPPSAEEIARQNLADAKNKLSPKAGMLEIKEAELKALKDAEKKWADLVRYGNDTKQDVVAMAQHRRQFASIYKESEVKATEFLEKHYDVFKNGQVDEMLKKPLQADIKPLKKEVKALAKELDLRYDELEKVIGETNVKELAYYGEKHTTPIRHFLDDAPNEQRTLWNKLADKLHVLNPTDSRGRRRKGAYYSTRQDGHGGVNLSINSVSKGDTIHAPYETVFHEFGHNMDFEANGLIGSGDRHVSFSSQYKNGAFGKKIMEEVDKAIEDYGKANGLVGAPNRGTVMQEAQRMINTGRLDPSDKMSWVAQELQKPRVDKIQAQKEFNKHIKSTYERRERANLSDMFEHAMIDKNDAYPFGAGHGMSYWGKDGAVYKTVGQEAFAEMYASAVAHPESLALIQKYLPESYKIFEEMLEVMNEQL